MEADKTFKTRRFRIVDVAEALGVGEKSLGDWLHRRKENLDGHGITWAQITAYIEKCDKKKRPNPEEVKVIRDTLTMLGYRLDNKEDDNG